MSAFLDIMKRVTTTLTEAMAGPVVPAVVAIGKDVVDLIKESKEVVSNHDAAELQILLDDLEPKVLAHADATEAALRGEQE